MPAVSAVMPGQPICAYAKPDTASTRAMTRCRKTSRTSHAANRYNWTTAMTAGGVW